MAPSEKEIASALIAAVHHCFDNEEFENLTVRKIRSATELELGLQENWFKNNSRWKDESKSIIEAESVSLKPRLDLLNT